MKVKLLAIAATLLLLSGCDDGSALNSDTETLRADKVWRMTATGHDLRVYEFTPQTLPNHQCVFVAGTKKSGLYCTEIPVERLNG